jgi:hypothetical protein
MYSAHFVLPAPVFGFSIFFSFSFFAVYGAVAVICSTVVVVV